MSFNVFIVVRPYLMNLTIQMLFFAPVIRVSSFLKILTLVRYGTIMVFEMMSL
jgi:hypothetical protein